LTKRFESADALVDVLLESVGKRLVVGLPVGLGKALHVANALFERASADPSISLTIFTGLTLAKPDAGSGLEARLAGPIVRRLYGAWPDVAYAEARARGELPGNVEVREFYLRPGAYLRNASVQQSYTSINYSRVVPELLELGVNVIAQLVAIDPQSPGRVSLSCNPEVTLDLLPRLEERRRAGERVAMVGQVNRALPYMPGDAELDSARIDFLLDSAEAQFPLFGLPNRRVSDADYATGMHVASLVPDGGTLQIGIGSLSDAVAHCLRLRHESPGVFQELLRRLPGGTGSRRRGELPVEEGPFETGLYACSELLSDALFSLFCCGIIRRQADELDDTLIHAGFFLGSSSLYEALRSLAPERRRRINMTSIGFVNSLFGDETRKRAQRRGGRFVNETMMATLLGTAVSDGLEDGRVVSGVGGQFDFVNMAGALEDARSVLMLKASRMSHGAAQSNIRWQYGHTSIPRQHRDVFVTEYGIAATRGKTDAETIGAMLAIADARFQQGLAEAALAAHKLPVGWSLPGDLQDNTPASVERAFSDSEIRPHFPPYPLGTDLTREEQRLAVALEWLGHATASPSGRVATALRALATRPASGYDAEMQRIGLSQPDSLEERLLRQLVKHALTATGA
jgi:acyl-CoA hydrolase